MHTSSTTRRTTDPSLTVATLLLAVGLGIELRTGALGWTVGVLLGVTLLSWLLAVALEPRQPEVDRAVRVGPPLTCAALLACNGLVRVTPWALLVVAALVLLSPGSRATTGHVLRWLILDEVGATSPARPSAEELAASRRRHPSVRPALPPPETVATSALARAWADSYFALRSSVGRPELEDIVELRGRYLDQMERSDPDGFAAWLRAGADPARCFHPRAAGPSGT